MIGKYAFTKIYVAQIQFQNKLGSEPYGKYNNLLVLQK